VTFEERVQALRYLDLTDRQARFVVTVALHGGYCLRRQYEAFARIAYGGAVRVFLDSLVARSEARRFRFRRDRGYVYHLHRTSLYDAIEQRDNRNRRHVSAAAIARKLMVLDYVLTERTGEWIATEDDKVRLFTHRFGLSRTALPQRVFKAHQGTATTTRFFVHKLPIHLSDEGDPTFVYLATDTTGAGMTQFMQDHLPLLDALRRWRIVAIAPSHIPGLTSCGTALGRFCQLLRATRGESELADLKAYFQRRRALERGQIPPFGDGAFSRAAADWRAAQQRFRSAEYETLYGRWTTEGDSALSAPTGQGFLAAVEERRGELVTRVLPYRYDRFGTFAGLS
jgi:hypothetical protein